MVNVQAREAGHGSWTSYDGGQVVIDRGLPPEEAAPVYVHEMNHVEHIKTGKRVDVSTSSREEYIDGMMKEDAEGQFRAIEFNQQRVGNGLNPAEVVFQRQYEKEYDKVVAEMKSKYPFASPEALHQVGREAGKQKLAEIFKNAKGSRTREPYAEIYGSFWDRVHTKKGEKESKKWLTFQEHFFMVTDIKQQLYQALIAASRHQYANYILDPMTDIEIYPTLFLKHYKIYQMKHFLPTTIVLLYLGFAPNMPVYSLVGNPEAFKDLAKADQVEIKTLTVAINYAAVYLEVTRNMSEYFFLSIQ